MEKENDWLTLSLNAKGTVPGTGAGLPNVLAVVVKIAPLTDATLEARRVVMMPEGRSVSFTTSCHFEMILSIHSNFACPDSKSSLPVTYQD